MSEASGNTAQVTPARGVATPPQRNTGLALAAASGGAFALAVAQGAERLAGLVPCALCLVERWPYRVVIALALLAAVLRPRGARALLWLAAAAFGVAAGLGALHVGVEQGWWPSPLPECAAPRLAAALPTGAADPATAASALAARLAAMPAHPSKPCEAPTFLVPGLPVSMAAFGGLYALVFAAGLAISLSRSARRQPWTTTPA